MKSVPDRLSTQQGAPFYRGKEAAKDLRIWIDGIEQKATVVEYCISKHWARVLVLENGKPKPNITRTGLATKLVRGEIKVERSL